MVKRTVGLLLVGPLLALGISSAAQARNGVASVGRASNAYTVTNLVSDQLGHAMHVEPNLVNAWGLAAGPTSPWWVADNGTDVSTLYDQNGTANSLVVKVRGGPTGTVFNGGSGFVVSHKGSSGPALFLFDSEDGKLRGWSPAVPPPAPSTRSFVVANRSSVGAIYKGLAIASTSGGDFLYAADFHNARVDVFDSSFNLVNNANAFVDPGLPAHFAPFGIQNIDGTIFVTYAKQDAAAEDEIAGKGLGYVDMFDTDGTFLGRVASAGRLNAPWGLALAPSDFGRFGGDLLVANFGDGRINAFAPTSTGYVSEGPLRSATGRAVAIDGLWALEFGNGGPSGPPGTLFFTAGPEDETHGLFGKIEASA